MNGEVGEMYVTGIRGFARLTYVSERIFVVEKLNLQLEFNNFSDQLNLDFFYRIV